MTTNESIIFALMVFVAVVMLAVALIVPTAGTAAEASRRMRRRIARHLELSDPGVASMVRSHYLNELSPLERRIETIPWLRPLSETVEQSGARTSTASLLLKGSGLGLIVFGSLYFFLGSALVALPVGALFTTIPILNIYRLRARRMNRFEEQLPEALDIMARALKAGHPFTETLNLIAEEMNEPISSEFGRVFSDLNFGMPLKTAFQGMLVRVPSMSLHTLVTAVLIQRESGGALAEILDKVAGVIRSRFKLQRKIKTLSAEGRMSAWVLAMVPFVLALAMSITSPNYLPILLQEPLGRKLILGAFVMLIIGVVWIRKIIRVEV